LRGDESFQIWEGKKGPSSAETAAVYPANVQESYSYFVTTYIPKRGKLENILSALKSLIDTAADDLTEAWLCEKHGYALAYTKSLSGSAPLQKRPLYANTKKPCLHEQCEREMDQGSCGTQQCKGCIFCPGEHELYSDSMDTRQVMLQEQLDKDTDKQITEKALPGLPDSLLDDGNCNMVVRQMHTEKQADLNVYTGEVAEPIFTAGENNFETPVHDGKFHHPLSPYTHAPSSLIPHCHIVHNESTSHML
jgi:hypothetical protein